MTEKIKVSLSIILGFLLATAWLFISIKITKAFSPIDQIISLYTEFKEYMNKFSTQELNNEVVQNNEELNTEVVRQADVFNVKITTYNPEVGQTDGSPCIGAIGKNVCQMYSDGLNPIAVSRDLIYSRNARAGYCQTNCSLNWGDTVEIVSEEPQCNIMGTVVDTMNRRFTNRLDIFKPTRNLNTSCVGNIYILNKSQ